MEEESGNEIIPLNEETQIALQPETQIALSSEDENQRGVALRFAVNPSYRTRSRSRVKSLCLGPPPYKGNFDKPIFGPQTNTKHVKANTIEYATITNVHHHYGGDGKSEESPSTSGAAGARAKQKLEKGGTIGNKKDLLSSIDKENLSAEKQEEFPTSDSSEASEDVTEDCVQLSDSIWMFPDRRISTHGEIYEGELRSGICDAVPIVLKLVENIPQNMTEARILAKLKHHSHVLSLIHAGTFNFRFVDQIYIALDKCHHENLREFVTNRKEQGFAFNLSRAIEIAGQMVDGVKYIHDNRIIHKDIKPDNILFSPNLGLIKIADFGLSQEIESTSTEVFEKGQFGTNGFRPPESFGGGIISQKSDIFSLGVTFYFVLSNGEHPFGEDRAGWNYHMQNGEIDFTGLPNIRNLKSTEHLIKSMIEHKINHRPTIWQVSEHPFWTGNEVSCDFDYRCPESSLSLIPPTPEGTSHSMDWHLVLERINKRIELSNKAAATKSQQRAKDDDEELTASITKSDLTDAPTHYSQFSSLKVSVRQGDITKDENDVIVNSIGHTFRLSYGGTISKVIKNIGGKKIQEELLLSSDNKIRVTSGGNLPCKKIIHVNPSWDVRELNNAIYNNLVKANTIYSILMKAEELQYRSLALPAIGTGRLAIPVDEVADVMFSAIKRFSTTSVQYLKVIDVVIFQQNMVEVFQRHLLLHKT